jgi:ketosteroid isomerase-like protein
MSEDVGAEVLARADEWHRLIEARDATGVLEYLHDDYALVLVHPAEAIVSRAEWLVMLPDYVVHGGDFHARSVHVDGDTALVLASITQRATVMGADRTGPFVVSDCWRRGDDGRWLVWRRHSTPLSAGPMPRR